MPTQPYRVLIVTGVYPTKETPHLGTFIQAQVNSLIAAGLEVEILHPPVDWPTPLRYVFAAVQVFLKTLTSRFDVVHAYYGLWCLAARLQWTTPVVASFLGSDLLCSRLPDGSVSKKDLLVARISRWLSRRVDAVNVKSEEMKRVLGEDGAIVYPDGIDFELFAPMERDEARDALGWDLDRYYILFGNNPNRPEKNFALAQAAVESLHARGIDAELAVVHSLPQTQVVQYINASNAVILSSLYEGSPNIVKEAMACNVPVVTTNVGDVTEVIGQTRGCKVCDSDPEALALGLEEALLYKERTSGRATIAHLERSVIARRIIELYEQISKQRKPLSDKTAFSSDGTSTLAMYSSDALDHQEPSKSTIPE